MPPTKKPRNCKRNLQCLNPESIDKDDDSESKPLKLIAIDTDKKTTEVIIKPFEITKPVTITYSSAPVPSTHEVILPSDRETIQRELKPNIFKVDTNVYKILIPNSPTNVEFQIEILPPRDNLPTRSKFHRSPNNPEIFLLESHYPIYDKDGKVNARLATKRQYSKACLAQTKSPIMTSSLDILHDKQSLYEEKIHRPISSLSSQNLITNPNVMDKIHSLSNMHNYTFTRPLTSSQEIYIQSRTQSDGQKDNDVIKSLPDTSDLFSRLKNVPSQTSFPTVLPNTEGPSIQGPNIQGQSPVSPAAFIQTWKLVQSMLSQQQQTNNN